MDSRAAVTSRLRSLFDTQSAALAEYLRLIDAQERSLRQDEPARFEEQLEAERALLDRLVLLGRASNAIEDAYRAACPAGDPRAEASRALAVSRAGAVAALAGRRRAALESRQAEVSRRLRALERGLARTRAFAPGPGAGPDSAATLDISR